MRIPKSQLLFTNPETDAKFDLLTNVDQFVDVPARKGDGTCYRGMLSAITPDAADRYVRWGSQWIKRKDVAATNNTDNTDSDTTNNQSNS